MKYFAVVALFALIVQYILALLSAIVDQSKVPVISWLQIPKKEKDGKETVVSKKIVSAELREMTDVEKRKRFLWFALSSIPAILFLLVYLIL